MLAARTRDTAVLACAAGAIALLWVPYYYDAFAHLAITPLDAWDDGEAWWPGGVLLLVMASGGLTAPAIRRERTRPSAMRLRVAAAIVSTVAAVVAVVHAVVVATRVSEGTRASAGRRSPAVTPVTRSASSGCRGRAI